VQANEGWDKVCATLPVIRCYELASPGGALQAEPEALQLMTSARAWIPTTQRVASYNTLRARICFNSASMYWMSRGTAPGWMASRSGATGKHTWVGQDGGSQAGRQARTEQGS
jgi:hypothetical protein